jgi:protein-S-isoprenylcysteine O-methyltransferase Ste14
LYLGLSAIQPGLGIALGNLWILVLLVPVVLQIHFSAILPEERYLERRFGDEYLRFKESVRRWI